MENVETQDIQKEVSNGKTISEEKESVKLRNIPQYATVDELMEKEIIPWLDSLELE